LLEAKQNWSKQVEKTSAISAFSSRGTAGINSHPRYRKKIH